MAELRPDGLGREMPVLGVGEVYQSASPGTKQLLVYTLSNFHDQQQIPYQIRARVQTILPSCVMELDIGLQEGYDLFLGQEEHKIVPRCSIGYLCCMLEKLQASEECWP